MPKRSAQDKLKHYERKIRKIQEQQNKKRRSRRILDSSDDENVEDTDNVESYAVIQEGAKAPTTMLECQPEESEPPPASPTPPPAGAPDATQPEDTQVPPTEVAPEPELSLDPELLSALGASTSDTPDFGEAVHDSLATLWLPLLRKGLPKETIDKLVKDYLVPINCKLLQSPKLNPEIAAAVSDTVRGRAKKLANFQQMLGTGITAVNRAMDTLLKSDDKIKSLKYLSDSCRLLSDLHHSFTKDRVKLVTPSLERNVLHVIHDAERDDTLFGNSLGEKIKACKAIEKQGQQIRKSGYQTKQCWSSAFNKPPCPSGKLDRTSSLPIKQGGAGRSTETNVKGGASTLSFDGNSTNTVEELQSTQESCQHTALVQGVPPPAQHPYPGCREALRTAFARRDVPPAALDLMLASLSDNTVKQYSVSLKVWWQFCMVNNIDVFDNIIPYVMSFLTEQFNKGCSYGSLNSHRSALSLLLGDKIGSDDRIKRILKGAYKIKPNCPKYHSTWDPQVVLNYISNWHPNLELPLEKITKKLSVLLALCTAHRVQTISLIKIENIVITDSGVKIFITDTIKTSTPGRNQPVLYLPYFQENLNICPASVLKDYIFLTKNLRMGNAGNLLLTIKKPHKAATAQSVSRWIKAVLSESGVDTRTFSAHSTRHAATSAARSAGLNVDAIRKTAGWTSTSNSFARYYNSPIINADGDFTRAVFNQLI